MRDTRIVKVTYLGFVSHFCILIVTSTNQERLSSIKETVAIMLTTVILHQSSCRGTNDGTNGEVGALAQKSSELSSSVWIPAEGLRETSVLGI